MMKKRILLKRAELCFCMLVLLLTFMPVCGLFLSDLDVAWLIPSGRQLRLLRNTALLGGIVAAVDVCGGFMTALWIYNSSYRNSHIRWIFFSTMMIPFYVYALGWMYLIRFLGKWLPGLTAFAYKGLPACIWIESAAFLALSSFLFLFALERLDRTDIEMGMLYGSSGKTLRYIILPEMMPTAAAVWCIVFVLSATDFSVPSLFQYNTYTLEIFSVYSGYGNVTRAMLTAVPLLILILLAVFSAERGVKNMLLAAKSKHPVRMRWQGRERLIFCAVLAYYCFQTCFPLLSFSVTAGSPSEILRVFAECLPEVGNSMLVGALSAMLSVLFAVFPARRLVKEKKHKGWWLLYVFPFLLSEQLSAMGYLQFANRTMLRKIRRSIFMPALGCTLHYAPLGILLIGASYQLMDRQALEMGRIFDGNPFHRFVHIELKMLRSGIAVSAGLIFMLVFNNEGMTLLLMPPGRESAAVKLYNYLHYGASEFVSAYSLILLLLYLCAAGAAAFCFGNRKKL